MAKLSTRIDGAPLPSAAMLLEPPASCFYSEPDFAGILFVELPHVRQFQPPGLRSPTIKLPNVSKFVLGEDQSAGSDGIVVWKRSNALGLKWLMLVASHLPEAGTSSPTSPRG